MNTLLAIYQESVQAGKIKANPSQQAIILALDQVFQSLLRQKRFAFQLKKQLYRRLGVACPGVKGIYLWGGVGRGKTFLMDMFYHALPFAEKKRFHFHHFMQHVHHALQLKKGMPDPLKEVAADFAKSMDVLCFDEFYVEDIGDAMILAALFKHLFWQGVTLIVTSNAEPEQLYLNGLQRDKFLPAITLIQQFTSVLALNHAEDYRMQFLHQHKLYHYPLTPQSALQMAEAFDYLSDEPGIEQKVLIIMNRSIPTVKCGEGIVWFSFESLCTTARSVQDYIEIARSFHIVLLSDVKRMGNEAENHARRFIGLVDEFYDRHVTLILSAQVSLDELYHGTRYKIAFQRTLSRLTEMQSTDYLAKPHLG